MMKLKEIKENWAFIENIGSISYWLEPTDDGSGKTISPKDILEIGCQLEAREASARAIMEKFVGKVDRGMAKSVETYAEMKEWLDE